MSWISAQILSLKSLHSHSSFPLKNWYLAKTTKNMAYMPIFRCLFCWMIFFNMFAVNCEYAFSRQANLICPVGIYMFKVNNRNTRTRHKICSKLTIETPERCQWHHYGVFMANFEHISHLVLVFLLLTLNR